MGRGEFFGGFDPFLNDSFYVGESFFVGLLVVGAEYSLETGVVEFFD